MENSSTQSGDGENGRVRQRASTACQPCRARKTRCDVSIRGTRCSNCQEFGLECIIPQSRRKRTKLDQLQRTSSATADKRGPWLTHAMSPIREVNAGPAASVPRKVSVEGLVTRSEDEAASGVALMQPSTVDLATFPHLLHEMDESAEAADNNGTSPTMTVRAGKPSIFKPDNALPLDGRAVEYLRASHALDIPSPSYLNESIKAYFAYVHPLLPVVDKSSFLREFEAWDQEHEPLPEAISLFLLQAMVFAASTFVPTEALRNAGYSSRKEARQLLFRKARLLYDFDHEPKRVAVLQGVLLMANYFHSLDDRKNTWHWVGIAVDLALTLRLHRDPLHNPDFTLYQSGIRKRLWWSCVVRDRLASLGVGRPPRILSQFTDVSALTLDDFEESGERVRSEGEQRLERLFVALTELCRASEPVWLFHFSMTRPRATPAQVAELSSKLEEWYQHLPPDILSEPSFVNIASDAERQFVLHRNVLMQNYQSIIVTLNQPHILRVEREADSALQQAQHASRMRLMQSVIGISHLAAQLVNLDLVRFCPTSTVICLLTALAFHFSELRAADLLESHNVHLNRFDICLMALRGLRDSYWAPERYVAAFENAFNELLLKQKRSHQASESEGFVDNSTLSLANAGDQNLYVSHNATSLSNPTHGTGGTEFSGLRAIDPRQDCDVGLTDFDEWFGLQVDLDALEGFSAQL